MKIISSKIFENFSSPKANPCKNQSETLKYHLPKFIFAKINLAKTYQIRKIKKKIIHSPLLINYDFPLKAIEMTVKTNVS